MRASSSHGGYIGFFLAARGKHGRNDVGRTIERRRLELGNRGGEVKQRTLGCTFQDA